VAGEAQVKSEVSVAGEVQVTGEVSVAGEVQVTSEVSVAGEVSAAGEVQVAGEVSVAGEVQVTGEVSVAGEVLEAFLDGDLNFTDCLEILAVANGIKRVARFTVPGPLFGALERLSGRLGLCASLAPYHLVKEFANSLEDSFARIVPGFPGACEEGVVFVGTPESVREAAEMEARGCAAGEAADLYGYPSCCAANYESAIQNGKSFWVDSFLGTLTGVVSAPWVVNRFGRLFDPCLSMLPDYFPCRIGCEESRRLGGTYLSMLRDSGLCLIAGLAERHLSAPVVRQGGCLYRVRPENGAVPSPEGPPVPVEVLNLWSYSGTPLAGNRLEAAFDADGALALRPAGSRALSGMPVVPADCRATYVVFS
jgi:hypothetical protein